MAIEIERKYLLASPPDLDEIRARCGDLQVAEIEQRYVDAPAGVERRVRRRTSGGLTSYVLTEKRPVAGSTLERTEDETTIEVDRYEAEATATDGAVIRKRRHHFVHDGQAFELDQFFEPIDAWLLEIELTDPTDEVRLPPFLAIAREVTDDRQWRNAAIARR